MPDSFVPDKSSAADSFIPDSFEPDPVTAPLPNLARPPIPQGLRPGSDALDVEQDIRSSTPDPLTAGFRQAQTGVNRLIGQYPWSQGPSARYAQGASEVIRGTTEAALPFVGAGMGSAAARTIGAVRTLPELGAVVRQAVPVVGGVAGSIGAQVGVEKAMTAGGAPQGVAQLAGDVAGAVPLGMAVNPARRLLTGRGRPPAQSLSPNTIPSESLTPPVTIPPPPGHVGPPTPLRSQPQTSLQPPPNSLSEVQRMQSLQGLNERLPVPNSAEQSAQTLMSIPQPKSAADSAQVFEPALATRDAVERSAAMEAAQGVRRQASQIQPDTPYIAEPAVQAAPPLYSIPQPKSAIESAQVFENARRTREGQEQVRQSKQNVQVPETGVPETQSRLEDFTERQLGQRLRDMSPEDQSAAAGMYREYLETPGKREPAAPIASTAPAALGTPRSAKPTAVQSEQPGQAGRQLPTPHPVTRSAGQRGAVGVPPLGPKMKAFREGFQNPEKYAPSPAIPKRERRPISQVTFSTPQADDFSKDVSLFYNVDKMASSPEAKAQVQSDIQSTAAEIYSAVGDRLKFSEIQSLAEQHPEWLAKNATTREQTAADAVRRLNARMQVAGMWERVARDGKFTPEDAKALRIDKSLREDAARVLASYNIKAQQPTDRPVIQQIVQDVMAKVGDIDAVLAEANKYDLTDPEQATKFYRTFIKPTNWDWANALRYSSMLSSPNTHSTNIVSNLLSAPVAAAQKAVAGGIDAALTAGSKLTGTDRPRTRYAGESVQYLKGYFGNAGLATDNFVRTLRNEAPINNPDFKRQIPLTTKDQKILRSVENTLTAPQKFLEAADQFFMAMASGGERQSLQFRQQRGIPVPNIDLRAQQQASHSMFRSKLGESATGGEQGSLLDLMDVIPQHILLMRNSPKPAVKFVANIVQPFVSTPANIFKQGVEYSPMGWGTLSGHHDKIGQAAKAAIGTSVATGLALLASTDRLTWNEPTDPKAKAEFRSAGRLPYAVQVGDKWVQYSRLHPSIAFPFAAVANVKQLYDSGKMSDDEAVGAIQLMARHFNFLFDQSYMKSMGDFVGAAKGEEGALARYLTNPVTQFLPYRGFVQWVERLTDPVQHRADPSGTIIEQQWQQLKTIVPGLAQTVPARTDKQGQPVQNRDRAVNALAPTRISTVDPKREEQFKTTQRRSVESAKLTKADNKLRSEAEREWQTIRQIQDPTAQYNKLMEAMDRMTPKGQDPDSPDYKLTPGQRKLIDLYKSKDLTPDELSLKSTRTDLRAKEIHAKWQQLPAGERQAYLEGLEKKKIITDDVADQLEEMGVR